MLVTPEGHFEFEAAHGTVQRHFRLHQQGEPTSTNSSAIIFAWAGALERRGELDGTPELVNFAWRLVESVTQTIESGVMTADLATLCEGAPRRVATTEEFVKAVADRLQKKLRVRVPA